MKYILSLLIVLISLNLSFSQNVKFEQDYKEALNYAKKKNALVLFYFINGDDMYTEENIEDNVLKSSNFKRSIDSHLVIIKVDESGKSYDDKYNNRMLLAYNPQKEFPSIRVVKPNSSKKTSLLTSFNDKDIILFIDEINTLNN